MIRLIKLVTVFLFSSIPLYSHGIEVFEPFVNLIKVLVYSSPVLVAIAIFVPFFMLRKKTSTIDPVKQPINPKIIQAWREAAKALNFEFEPNFRFQVDGLEFTLLGYIRHFGSPKGTFLGPIIEKDAALSHIPDRLSALGFFYSELSDSYSTFEKDRFRDTLNDFGYFGPSEKIPSWYTGKPWS